MPDDLMRYDLLVQDALRGVVRKVLGDAARDGLPGEHHFYISFRTDAPGVKISSRLKEKYPADMTIVLQHQFWDLILTEASFEVGLSFSGVAERLFVPFSAVTGFFDPSVQFGLKFELAEDEAADDAPAPVEAAPRIAAVPVGPRAIRGAASEPAETSPKEAGLKGGKPKRTAGSGVPKLIPPPASPAQSTSAPASSVEERGADKARAQPAAEAPESGAEVVSLDAFRKKN